MIPRLNPCARCNGSGTEPEMPEGARVPIPPEAITAVYDKLAAIGYYGHRPLREVAADITEAASPVLRAADAETIARKDRELDGLRRENEHIRSQLAARETTP